MLDQVLTQYAMHCYEIRLNGPDAILFFPKVCAKVPSVPRNLRWMSAADETSQCDDRFKLKLIFTLNRGQYATMLVKYLDTLSGSEIESINEAELAACDDSDPLESEPEFEV